MKTLRWLIGTIVLLGLAALIILLPIRSIFLPEGMHHAGFVSRCLYILLLAALMVVYRVIMGPTAADRIVAIDIFGILIVGLCAVLGIATGTSWYIDIGIAWALQSFIGSLALAKFLEGRSFHD
jgi:multicomponent Na+:H+ antiporter subunit F